MKILKFLGLTLLLCIAALTVFFYEGDIPKDVVDARYTSIDSQFADFGDLGRIHYRDEGNRRAPPFILLHGSSASLHTFEPWVAELDDEFRLITLDLPGHGLTGEIPSRTYNQETMFAVIDALADQLQLDAFILGGNSMGGGLSWRYTLANPEKVLGLVLIDASGNRSWDTRPKDENGAVAGFNLIGKPWFRSIAQLVDPYYLVSQGLKASFSNKAVVSETMIMRYNDLLLREGSRRALVDRVSDYRRSGETPDVLNQITVPTLIMWGKEDALIPFSFATVFADNINDVTTAYYDNVGHIPMEEIPVVSAIDLAAFLRTIGN